MAACPICPCPGETASSKERMHRPPPPSTKPIPLTSQPALATRVKKPTPVQQADSGSHAEPPDSAHQDSHGPRCPLQKVIRSMHGPWRGAAILQHACARPHAAVLSLTSAHARPFQRCLHQIKVISAKRVLSLPPLGLPVYTAPIRRQAARQGICNVQSPMCDTKAPVASYATHAW